MILSVSSREKAMNCINAAYNWGIMMHYVSDNPMKFVINKIKDSLNAESSKYSDDIDVEHFKNDINGIKRTCDYKISNNVIIEDNGVSLTKDVIADKSDLLKIVQELKESGFDMLRLISSVDYSDKFFIVYHFLSTVNSNVFTLKVPLIKSDASKIDSLCDLYDSANWLEREVYDLMGIEFINHPNLKRILLPLDWEGYPLRKDYVMPNEYHGISKD